MWPGEAGVPGAAVSYALKWCSRCQRGPAAATSLPSPRRWDFGPAEPRVTCARAPRAQVRLLHRRYRELRSTPRWPQEWLPRRRGRSLRDLRCACPASTVGRQVADVCPGKPTAPCSGPYFHRFLVRRRRTRCRSRFGMKRRSGGAGLPQGRRGTIRLGGHRRLPRGFLEDGIACRGYRSAIAGGCLSAAPGGVPAHPRAVCAAYQHALRKAGLTAVNEPDVWERTRAEPGLAGALRAKGIVGPNIPTSTRSSVVTT